MKKFKAGRTLNPIISIIGLLISFLLPTALYEFFQKRPIVFTGLLMIFFVFFLTNYEEYQRVSQVYCHSDKVLLTTTGLCVEECPKGMFSDTKSCVPCFNLCKECNGPWNVDCDVCIEGYEFAVNQKDEKVCFPKQNNTNPSNTTTNQKNPPNQKNLHLKKEKNSEKNIFTFNLETPDENNLNDEQKQHQDEVSQKIKKHHQNLQKHKKSAK